MGADIHAYVEYADFVTNEGKDYYKSLTSNFGSRNYYLFGLMAGVRGPDGPVFEVRGMPEGNLSYDTQEGYWTNVAPEAHPEWADTENWTSKDNADQWISNGYSVPEYDDKGVLKRVSVPDWHSHSWLTTDELEKVLVAYSEGVQRHWAAEKGEAPIEWQAILAAMKVFEQNGKKARVVFWFDN